MKTMLPVTLGLLLMASPGNADSSELSGLLPGEVQGWSPAEPDALYDGETLYRYINGAAEVYRALNVRAVCGRRYIKRGAAEILADVFDMGSASDAFGAYHHDIREGESAGIGQESEHAGGALAFWKGPYFVSIIPLEDSTEASGAALELGRSIAAKIRDAGTPPDLVFLLPEQGLRRGWVRYFHGHASLGRYYSLAEENILNLDRNTEALLASYDTPGPAPGDSSRHVLLLVRYPSAAHAARGLNDFRAGYQPAAGEQAFGRTHSGGWYGVRVVDRLLIGVFDAPSEVAVEQGLKNVQRRIDP